MRVPGSRAPEGAIPAPSAAGAAAAPLSRPRAWFARHERALLVAAGAAVALAVVGGYAALSPKPQRLTQQDIDAAVLHTLENNALPSPAAKAYEAVRRSVVRVRGFGYPKAADAPSPGSKAADPNDKAGKDRGGQGSRRQGEGSAEPARTGRNDADDGGSEGVGTGVVIVDNGIILTNLHVVWRADAHRRRVRRRHGVDGDRHRACGPSTISRCCRRRRCPTTCPRRRCARRRT